MLKRWLAVSALVVLVAGADVMAQVKKTGKSPKTTLTSTSKMSKPSTDAQKASYAIGADLAKNLGSQNIEFDIDFLVAAMKDVKAGNKLALSDDEMKAAFESLQKQVQSKSESKNKVIADKNEAEGKAFLTENAKKEGVKTLPSGLQYLVMKEGNGPKPSDTSKVTTHYHGTLLDGTVFDSSVDRGQPATFPVNGVIKGWQEALPLMPTGSKWKLFVPANLAYGNRGAGEKIGPGATLIFEVELLKIGE